MTAYLPLILDGVVAALLIATIVYAVTLNRQLARLRDGRAELADYIKGLNDATANAEAAVRGLRKAAGETGEQLQRSVDKAQALRDELQFMIESGNALADRLGVASAGAGDRSHNDRGHSDRGHADKSRNDPHMEHRAGDMRVEPRQRPQPAAPARGGGPARQPIDESLMAAARAEAARHTGGQPAAGAPRGSGGGSGGEGDGLSRAERELLQALESRR